MLPKAPKELPVDRASSPIARSLRERELDITRAIAQAFLTADEPIEVFRLALARVTPLVSASFSSVFLRDPSDPSLLKLECALNWPQPSARYLGQMRIRVGRGPTGRAVSERAPVEVANVFADAGLREWWEPARELGFSALITLPLGNADEPHGALSFYFAEPHTFDDEERQLITLTASQLETTTVRARLVEELRSTNARLQRQNEALLARVGKAEEAKRLKNEFLSNMSHELRTPLNSILGYTYLLGAGQTGPVTEEQKSAVDKIDASANVLLRLITDLLDLSQLKLGRAELMLAPTDAVRIAQGAAEHAGEPHEAVHYELKPQAPRIPMITDAEKVEKILVNLLSNAFKFTRQGSVTVSIAACRSVDEEWVEWAVRDTGIGIPEDDRAAVFDEFRQVDGSSTRLYGGTGLGLALSRQLAWLLGGDITLESEVGLGSVFRLRLPERSSDVTPTSR